MAPKIEFRDRSSGQRGSSSDVLEGPKLSCAWKDRRSSLEGFFESHFWFMFSQCKLKCLPSSFQDRHLDWGLTEKHRYFHFITIPFDSIQFRVLSKVQSWFKTPLITTPKQSSDQCPFLRWVRRSSKCSPKLSGLSDDLMKYEWNRSVSAILRSTMKSRW